MALQSSTSLRLFATIFAAVLALQAAWIVAAELSRPTLPFFPSNQAAAETAAAHNTAANAAAFVGWPRGDLAVDAAITANAAVVDNIEGGKRAGATDDRSYNRTVSAAALAPADARAWLLLAMLSQQTRSDDAKAQAQLKMSYYTSPYNADLFPLRIQLAARLPIITDDELRSFVGYELGMIIREKPDLKQSVLSAFRNGSPAGRQMLQAAAKNDADLLTKLHAIGP
jgi:hypothetical protein